MKNSMVLLIAGLFVGSLNAHATNMECSGASGNLKRVMYQYIGGVPPRPGMVMTSDTWSYAGTVLRKDSTLYQTREVGSYFDSDPVASEVVVDLISSALIDGSHVKDRPDGYLITVQKVRLSHKDGTPVLPQFGISILEEFMICNEVILNTPRP